MKQRRRAQDDDARRVVRDAEFAEKTDVKQSIPL